ncbi:MAG: alpha/beta hydrolase family protein [Actinomycetota bacterium]
MARVPEERFPITTPKGDVSAVWLAAAPDAAALVVGHGAGSGMDHPFLVGFCQALADEGVATLRVNFPYMEAGRRSPGPAAQAEAAFAAALGAAAARTRGSVFAGGKSYGGRIASMVAAGEGGTETAAATPIAGLVFLGYPLHAPGHPEKVRDAHLYEIRIPMLFLRGTKDPFADDAALAPVLQRLGARARSVSFEDAGHSFERSRKDDPRTNGAVLAPHVATFIRELA